MTGMAKTRIPTHAMVLAAGLGLRMRPLTRNVPKPMLDVGGRSMLDHALDRLEDAGVAHVVVNTHWLPEQIEDHLKNRDQYLPRRRASGNRRRDSEGVAHAGGRGLLCGQCRYRLARRHDPGAAPAGPRLGR
jgi:NDP-sugar pyrophosphorylase family protein